MAMNAGQMIGLVGIAGVGGYVLYEYTRYSHAISLMDTQSASVVKANLPFTSYLMANFSTPQVGTPEGNAYHVIQIVLGNTSASVTPAPGTSSSGQVTTTSVTTTPGTTTQSTTNQTPSPAPTPPQPTAADLQKAINITGVATADEWNYGYRQLTGYGIEQLYGVGFDVIYGSVGSDGTRGGNITADAFLSLPGSKGFAKKSSVSGLGVIARFYSPVVNPMGSMVYRAQHPSPYRFPIGGGMGAFVQASGFEKALWSGHMLQRNKFV